MLQQKPKYNSMSSVSDAICVFDYPSHYFSLEFFCSFGDATIAVNFFLSMFSLKIRKDLYRAELAVTRSHGFCGLIKRMASISHLLGQARGT